MTEVGPVSFECPARPGVLHVIDTSYVAEVIDPQTGTPLHSGEMGELVLTTLGRIGSPLIRYRTGDLVKTSSDMVCECGRQETALVGGIIGRVDDMVVVRGVNVYPTAVEEIVRSVPDIVEYVVQVSNHGALTEMSVAVEVAPSAGVPANRARDLEAAFQRILALRVPVTVVDSGSLPRAEAKAQRWCKVPALSRG
jgi:phenylacetate-CoA ligase